MADIPITDYGALSRQISDLVLERHWGWRWRLALLFTLLLAVGFLAALGYLFVTGVGIWGINRPVDWGFAIANYVWWIGIGMAGTFISAALLLLHRPLRSAINRAAETMTVLAVAIAGIFPIMHLGRPWFAYWLAPYPNKMDLWPQWRSSLSWDFYALAAYVIVSIVFWYVSLLPDFATLRDRARRRGQQVFYGLLALGWRGGGGDWLRHGMFTRLLAGVAIVLVFSVHSMVALDFSIGLTPGWHTTLFPPFFVAGALFSGFALVLALGIPTRAALGLENLLTEQHLASLGRILLAASLFMSYCYVMEIFTSLYSGNPYERQMVMNRVTGSYAPLFWGSILCNSVIPLLLAPPRWRRNTLLLALVSSAVLVGMWLERVMLILTSLYQSYTPSAFGMFLPTVWDWIHLFGSIALFVCMYLVAVRTLPIIAIYEMRKTAGEARSGAPACRQEARP